MDSPKAPLTTTKVPDLVDVPSHIFFLITESLDGVAIVCCRPSSEKWYQASTQGLLLRHFLVSDYSRMVTKSIFSSV